MSISSDTVVSSLAQPLTLPNGMVGTPITIPSRTPRHFSEIIDQTAAGEVGLPSQIFLPPEASGQAPVVVLVPGSSGINASHLEHSNTLTSAGIATCIVDSFAGRNIRHTYHDQRLLTTAAGAYDVLAACGHLMQSGRFDPTRIGAMGPSRGGTAVLQACMRPLADAVLGNAHGLHTVLSLYPNAMFQFRDPRIGQTRLRIAMGNCDRWNLLSVAQGYANAIRLCSGDVALRIWEEGEHGFDRGDIPLSYLEAAVEMSTAPTYFMNSQGHFCDLDGSNANPGLTESNVRDAVHKRYGSQGVWLGSQPGQPESFKRYLLEVFTQAFLPACRATTQSTTTGTRSANAHMSS